MREQNRATIDYWLGKESNSGRCTDANLPKTQINRIRSTGIFAAHMLLASIFLGVSVSADATVFRPASGAEIVETLPVGSLTFKDRVQDQNPGIQPFDKTEPKIRALLQQAYNWGDPRALGQAESLLEPYRANNEPSVRLLRANIDQASHRFEPARQQLKAVLNTLPNEPESLLMLSAIELVQGNFDTARQHCNALNEMSLLVLKIACMAQVDSMTGRLQQSASSVARLMQLNSGLTDGQQRWLALMLADMAQRLNNPVLAKTAFEQLNHFNSAPVLAAKADWLLAHGQWQAVKTLLMEHTDNDALLVRLLVSEQHLNDANFKPHFELMRERILVWNERGETAHQREAAQYALLFENPQPALKLARLNWQKQRETADVVVYSNAAIRNGSRLDIKTIQDWIKKTGFEYPLVSQALAQAAVQLHSQKQAGASQ